MDPNPNMNPNPAVHRLPHDILHDLFVFSTEDAANSGVHYFSVDLSHVCSSWRLSALATPTIWTSLYTSTPSSAQENLRSAAYLARSQGMLVDVRVGVEALPSIHAPEFALLALHAHRIRKLLFVCADPAPFPTLLGCLAAEMPELEAFFMLVYPGKAAEFTVRLAPSQGGGPSRAVGPFRLPALADTGVRWSIWGTTNITHLKMNGLAHAARPSMESLWHILRGCKSTLETFEFQGWAPLWDDATSVLAPVVLPLLSALELFFLDDLAPLAVLIHAPDLQRLTLSNGRRCQNPYLLEEDEDEDEAECDVPRLLEHFSACGSALRQLFLYALPPCPRSTIDAFFASLPSLDSLMLFETDTVFQDALFQPECRFRVPRDAVFPVLSHLAITDTAPSDLTRFLLRHKTLPVPPLLSVYMSAGQYRAAYEPDRSTLALCWTWASPRMGCG
ncbi:hypothetical protein B0H17DRAFT_1135323 [Mycena rosella]|uniref:F-box domain-containing protein n=1 Tax=Mycena rosella TaxID=1033263 RepID=A0AAD7GFU0_MYCRO|nr:hypothetical protein B0H17DRAFT_1135323 [Mycena rosella]